MVQNAWKSVILTSNDTQAYVHVYVQLELESKGYVDTLDHTEPAHNCSYSLLHNGPVL